MRIDGKHTQVDTATDTDQTLSAKKQPDIQSPKPCQKPQALGEDIVSKTGWRELLKKLVMRHDWL